MTPKKKDLETPRSTGRPKTRSIVRWSDDKLLIVFAELRKTCATRKIDIRGALDDAVKVIAPTCTGDALVQQLVKRERRILDLWQTQDTPVQRGRADKQKEKEATEADTAREGDSGRANDVSTIDPPFSTPRNQTRAKKSNSLNNGANSAGAPSTSAHLKTENADDEEASPQTPSPAQYESDSDYTESPDKGKKKRIRGNVKQASKKSSTKKTRKQLIDSEDEQEDGLVETPTKKSAVKHLRRTPAKKNSATTLSIKAQPGTARKTLPKAETAVESAQPESDDEIEDKAYLGLKNAENAQIDVQDMNSQIKHSTSGSPGHMQSFREDSSGHDSFGSTPLSSNGFGGESFNGYSFGNDSFDNQSFDDNSFGGPLFGGNLDSFYQDQFVPFHMQGSATMPVLSGAMNSMLPGTMMANGMGNYAAMEMMGRKATHAPYARTMGGTNSGMFPGTAMSYAIQRPEVPASDDEQHSASYQSRTLSFDSDTSGTTASSSSQMNAFSGGEQRTLFANADRGYDNNVGFGNSVNQGLVFESEDDTPKRSRLTSGMGLLNFNV